MKKETSKSKYYKIDTPEGVLHIHINYEFVKEENRKKILSIFLRMPPLGTTVSSLVATLGIILSKYFENGGDPNKIIKHLYSIKSHKKIVIDENTHIDSIPQAIGLVISDFIKSEEE